MRVGGVILFLGLAGSALLPAQVLPMHDADETPNIPAGATLPIVILHGVAAGKAAAGATIQAKTWQRILLPGGAFLSAGAQVTGTVVSSQRGGSGSTLAVRFGDLRTHAGKTVALSTCALAAASDSAVNDAMTPLSRTTSSPHDNPDNWVTVQVGGDQVFRVDGKGPVSGAGMRRVGFADRDGVYSSAEPNGFPHAFGIFSTTARGMYGFGDGAKLSCSNGVITLQSPGKLSLSRGNSLLLQVLPNPAALSQ